MFAMLPDALFFVFGECVRVYGCRHSRHGNGDERKASDAIASLPEQEDIHAQREEIVFHFDYDWMRIRVNGRINCNMHPSPA
jgi:hypothetical protein